MLVLVFSCIQRWCQRSENVVCPECNQSIQKRALHTHIKVFHFSEGKPQYNVKLCTFQTIHSFSWETHVKNVHL